ncbi:hypothetical protein QEN19_003318 [Hanseniaspora menglaensis]
MDIEIKYNLNSVRVPFLNGSEEYKESESIVKRRDDLGNPITVTNYKFLQVPEYLLEHIGDQDLNFKGDAKNLFMTSNEETFQVKQNFHSNCVLLMKPTGLASIDYSAYTTQHSELELIQTNIPLDTSGLPFYRYEGDILSDDDNDDLTNSGSSIILTKNRLIASLPISRKEFKEKWKGSLLIELKDKSIKKIPYAIEADIMNLILVAIVSLNIDYTEIDYGLIKTKVRSLKDDDENIELLVTAILDKYTDLNRNLKMKEIAIFYGLKTLKQKCPFARRKFIDLNDFYMYWKESLPSYFNCDLDIDFLVGHFAKEIESEKVLEVDSKRLPATIQRRVPYLMGIQKTWEQKHIQPFFEELNEHKIKPDNFIMKFARRKKDKSGKYIVTER